MLKKARAEAKAQAESHGTTGGGDTQGKALSDSVLESSRQIWLAGLGAFARAKGEGVKVFETLVQQGQALESRTRKAATETATAAREAAQGKAKEMQAKAGGTWDKLEQVFEDRVARALARLGVYTQSDVERLAQRVDALSDAVNELIKATGARGSVPKASPAGRAGKGVASPAARAKGAASPAARGARKTGRTTAKAAKAAMK